MNWSLIMWVAGTLLTIYAIKFVFMAIKTLFSKDTMQTVSNAMGRSISRTNKKFKRYLKNKVDQRKSEEPKPVVTIR